MAAETATAPRARRARKTATARTRRKRPVEETATAREPDLDIAETAQELYAEAEGMSGLSDKTVARLAGAWGERCVQIGAQNTAAKHVFDPGERAHDGLSMRDLDWLLQQRGSRSFHDGHVTGYQAAMHEAEARERHVRREVLLGCFTMWRTELEQILKLASRPGAPADERRKQALDALVQHTADVAKQQGRLEEEAFGR